MKRIFGRKKDSSTGPALATGRSSTRTSRKLSGSDLPGRRGGLRQVGKQLWSACEHPAREADRRCADSCAARLASAPSRRTARYLSPS